jgi:hypothetical protein
MFKLGFNMISDIKDFLRFFPFSKKINTDTLTFDESKFDLVNKKLFELNYNQDYFDGLNKMSSYSNNEGSLSIGFSWDNYKSHITVVLN